MSQSLDFFFNTTHADERLIERLGEVCGLSFRLTTDGERRYCRFLSHTIFLEENIFRELEEYQVEKLRWRLQISKTSPSSIEFDIVSFALLSYLVMRASEASEGLLILDLQVPLARYLSKGRQFINTLANDDVVQFPAHITQVSERWRAVCKQ